jgi:hypothetical protein
VRVRLWRTAKASIFLLAHGKGRNVPFSPGAVRCFFLPCVVKKRTTKILYRALSDAAHAKGLYHAKCYRVPFAVRLDEKRTAKSLPCFFGPLPCARGANPLFPVVATIRLNILICWSCAYIASHRKRSRAMQEGDDIDTKL